EDGADMGAIESRDGRIDAARALLFDVAEPALRALEEERDAGAADARQEHAELVADLRLPLEGAVAAAHDSRRGDVAQGDHAAAFALLPVGVDRIDPVLARAVSRDLMLGHSLAHQEVRRREARIPYHHRHVVADEAGKEMQQPGGKDIAADGAR